MFFERPFVADGFNEDNRRFGLMSYLFGRIDDRLTTLSHNTPVVASGNYQI